MEEKIHHTKFVRITNNKGVGNLPFLAKAGHSHYGKDVCKEAALMLLPLRTHPCTLNIEYLQEFTINLAL